MATLSIQELHTPQFLSPSYLIGLPRRYTSISLPCACIGHDLPIAWTNQRLHRNLAHIHCQLLAIACTRPSNKVFKEQYCSRFSLFGDFYVLHPAVSDMVSTDHVQSRFLFWGDSNGRRSLFSYIS